MTRLQVGVLRAVPVGLAVFAVFNLAVTVPVILTDREFRAFALLLPFVAAGICAAGVGTLLGPVDRSIERITRLRAATPYSVLAEAAARISSGELDTALPGLAKVLVDATTARQASIWVVVSGRLMAAAVYPPPGTPPQDAANLAVLLSRPEIGHVVPVLDGDVLRAVLAIGKPSSSITAADRRLMHDIASGARLLLRSVALNTELRERVRQAAELGAELNRSRRRLTRARALERRRLAGELAHVTTGRLAEVRRQLAGVREDLLARRTEAAVVGLGGATGSLDDLLERFRSIARGVYPAVLRDQGPVVALEELAVDLPRRVDILGSPGRRLPWEVESGIYYLAASAMHRLAEQPGPPIRVTLTHANGRLSVEVVDPGSEVPDRDLRAALAHDLERLAALGGAVDLGVDGKSVVLIASLPDWLEPLVEVGP